MIHLNLLLPKNVLLKRTKCKNGHILNHHTLYFWKGELRGCKMCRYQAHLRYKKTLGGDIACRDKELRRLGWTVELYDEAVKVQNGLCAICGQSGRLYPDHDHQTGKKRALLCNACNTGLGKFEDNPDLLLIAFEYLKRHTSCS